MIFCMKIKIKALYKLVVSFLLVIARHSHSTKFVIYLQYLKKEGRAEVDFLLADKHQTILQVDTVNFGGHDQACPNYPKKGRMRFIFCVGEHSYLYLILSFLMGVARHA